VLEQRRLNCDSTLDVAFLCYLRRLARFGYFRLGPITIDVRLIEEIVEHSAVPSHTPREGLTADHRRFIVLLMEELRRSGRQRLDELHYLLAFMRCQEGLPGRVFSELGVTPEQVNAYLKDTESHLAEPAEKLLTPEQVAEYLQVHVETVRGWIRSGMLPARRIAGLRALRVRSSDVDALLQPLDGGAQSP